MEELNFNIADSLPDSIIPAFVNKETARQETRKLINDLINRYEQGVFSLLLYKLTQLKISPAKAREVWEMILIHKDRLNKYLRRDVGIFVASMDYFANFADEYIKNPVILDRNTLLEMKKNIFIDETTGLYNHLCFEKRLRQAVADAKRREDPLSLIVLMTEGPDKSSNPNEYNQRAVTYKNMGETIRTSIRISDTAFRVKDNEFVLLLPDTSGKGARIVREKLRKRVQNLFPGRNLLVRTGAATLPEETKKDGLMLYALAKLSLQKGPDPALSGLHASVLEKREHKRISIPLKDRMVFHFTGPLELAGSLGRIINISKGGMAVETRNSVLSGPEEIEGCIIKEGKKLRFKGRVVWSRDAGRDRPVSGIKFLTA
ncbi:MAG: diguanylate cyclase [bacterium]|nr:diguanylate cyclase [bacterium]